MNNKDNLELPKTSIPNMASTDKNKYDDGKLDIRSKYKGYTKDDLLMYLAELELKNDEFIRLMSKQLENTTVKKVSPRCIIEENQLRMGFYRFEKFCREQKISEHAMTGELLDWLNNNILEYVLMLKSECLPYLQIKKIIFERFDQCITKYEYRRKKQEDFKNVKGYINDMINYGMQLDECSEDMLITIKDNLHYIYKTNLSAQMSKDLNELKEICIFIERNYNKKINYKFRPTDNDRICYNCNEKGHIKSQCKNLGNAIKKAYIPKPNYNGLKKFSPKGKYPIGNIKIKDNDVECILDSGSCINIISFNCAMNLQLQPVQCAVWEGININGESVSGDKKVTIEFEFDSKIYIEDFAIMDIKGSSLPGIILGFDWLHKNKINIYSYLEKQKLIHEFPELFNNINKTGYRKQIVEIKTTRNEIIKDYIPRIPFSLVEKVNAEISRLLDMKYIRTSESHWRNPIRIVPKGNSVRLTMDCRKLNNLVEKEKYGLPRIDDILNGLREMCIFTKIDLKDGFHQILIAENDIHKTAFQVGSKIYEWIRLPQGFKNSPIIFQQIMDRILRNQIGKACYVYLDDIIVFGKNEEEHDKNVHSVLKCLNEEGLTINIAKFDYKCKVVHFLGFVIQENKYRIRHDQVNKAKLIQPPKTKKQLQRLLGFANYFRKFIENFSDLCQPLYMLLNKKVKWNWTHEHDKVLSLIKTKILNVTNLTIPDPSKPFIMYCDASNTGLGIILAQLQGEKEFVVEYASRVLQKAEKNYSISEKEALGIVWGVEYFDHYLRGNQFTVMTDHRALQYLKNETGKNARIRRWLEKLGEYDFKIVYTKGEFMGHVDYLSRLTSEQNSNDKDKNSAQVTRLDALKADFGFTTYKKQINHTLIGDKIIIIKDTPHYIKKRKLYIIPKICDRLKLVMDCHKDSGHAAANTVYTKLAENYFGCGMKKAIDNISRKCKICACYNTKHNSAFEFVATKKPFETVAIDIVGPYKKQYILTFIDYFTRVGQAYLLKTKKSTDVINKLDLIFKEYSTPKTLVSDNAKEFISNEMNNFLSCKDIKHHKTTIYNHESNGRIERFNRTFMNMLIKNTKEYKSETLSDLIKLTIQQYNSNYNRSILMCPAEAIQAENCTKKHKILLDINSKTSRYAKEINCGKKCKYNIGEKVWIKNLNRRSKFERRYTGPALITELQLNDCYIVDYKNVKKKLAHSQLKKFYS